MQSDQKLVTDKVGYNDAIWSPSNEQQSNELVIEVIKNYQLA